MTTAPNTAHRQVPLYLSDEVFVRMSMELNAALRPLRANQSAPGRSRRILTSIVMPAADDPDAGARKPARETPP